MKIAELLPLITTLFIKELYQEDLAEAEHVKAAGCPHCGGVLHCGNYQRKPRGIEGEVLRLLRLDWRISFCCGNEECRKRTTPKSVRFLGRKVYLGVSIVVAGILRGEGVKVAKICAILDNVKSETLRCWNLWWSGPVQSSNWWNVVKAQIMPPLEGKHFVWALFSRLLTRADGVKTAIQKLLTFISPITVPAQYPS